MCDRCYEMDEWLNAVLDRAHEATGWALAATPLSAFSPSGRPYANAPSVRLRLGVAIVTWSGGIDV